MRMDDERNTMHVIGVHIHSKDAYGRVEHDAHKIRAL